MPFFFLLSLSGEINQVFILQLTETSYKVLQYIAKEIRCYFTTYLVSLGMFGKYDKDLA